MSIEHVIQEIDDLFKEHNYDKVRFTVDYDSQDEGLSCYYAPFIENSGFYVSDYLLYVDETSEADLIVLRDYLNSKGIKSRPGYAWEPSWGRKE